MVRRRQSVKPHTRSLSSRGYRVLAVAYRPVTAKEAYRKNDEKGLVLSENDLEIPYPVLLTLPSARLGRSWHRTYSGIFGKSARVCARAALPNSFRELAFNRDQSRDFLEGIECGFAFVSFAWHFLSMPQITICCMVNWRPIEKPN
jgi:hypothetical protein